MHSSFPDYSMEHDFQLPHQKRKTRMYYLCLSLAHACHFICSLFFNAVQGNCSCAANVNKIMFNRIFFCNVISFFFVFFKHPVFIQAHIEYVLSKETATCCSGSTSMSPISQQDWREEMDKGQTVLKRFFFSTHI